MGAGGDEGPVGLRPEVKVLLNLKDEGMGPIVEELNARMKEAEDFLKITR